MEYETNVLIFLSRKNCEAFLSEFKQTFGMSSMRIGVSMPFSDLEKLADAWQQGRFALEQNVSADISHCRDCAWPYMLKQLTKQEMTPYLLHPALDLLSEYDAACGTEYLRTLTVYLREDRNQSCVSQKLHIHRNTLKYRLSRILELTGIDFQDPETRAYLSLSLALREQMEKKV